MVLFIHTDKICCRSLSAIVCFLFQRKILHWDHLCANKTISMSHIAIVSYFDSTVICISVRWETQIVIIICGTFRHIPKSNENKERGLISSLNDYSWALQAGTLPSIGVLSDGIINRLSQLLVHCTATTFLWSLLECVLNLREKLRQEWLSGCYVIIQFRIVGLKM